MSGCDRREPTAEITRTLLRGTRVGLLVQLNQRLEQHVKAHNRVPMVCR